MLVAGDERRRVGHGHFLLCFWWLGQALLLGLDMRHANTTGGSSGFFTDLFLVVSGLMALREFGGGVKKWFLDRREAKRFVAVEVVEEEPAIRKAA